jgi:hypothetical protein
MKGKPRTIRIGSSVGTMTDARWCLALHIGIFDSQESAALSEELERVLGLIRSNAYPAAARIHARELYVAGQVLLTVEPPLKEAVQNVVAPGGGRRDVCDGSGSL